MLILDWMKKDVITVSPKTTLLRCRQLFKDHQISTLPVVDTNKDVVGMLTFSQIKHFLPLGGTSLEILDALDTLEDTLVRDCMTKEPVTIDYRCTISQAAQLMIEKHVWALPVVNIRGTLVGFLSEWDVFNALVSISGASMPPGVEMAFNLDNKAGALSNILNILTDVGARISTVQSIFMENGTMRQVMIGFWSPDADIERNALEQLRNHPGLRYWAREGEVFLKDDPNFNL